MSQRQLARQLGLSPASITKLKRLGMPTHSVEAAQSWRSRNVGAYVRSEPPAPPPAHVADAPQPDRATAAPPAADAALLDLGQERAMLAREQRISIEMKNSVLRGEYAPISLLAEALAAASQAIVDRLDQLPARLRKTCPDLSDAARAEVMAAIADARNEWVSATVELVAAKLETSDDDDAPGEPPATP
jgi:phage terminase Nu1 subunit (DNA packaging protein)